MFKALTLVAVVAAVSSCEDDRPCLRSHQETVVITFVKAGAAMVPIYGKRTICDEYAK